MELVQLRALCATLELLRFWLILPTTSLGRRTRTSCCAGQVNCSGWLKNLHSRQLCSTIRSQRVVLLPLFFAYLCGTVLQLMEICASHAENICVSMSISVCVSCQHWIPSGEHTKSNGKSPFLMGKSTISMAIFNCYVSSTLDPPKEQILPGSWIMNLLIFGSEARSPQFHRGYDVISISPIWKCRASMWSQNKFNIMITSNTYICIL